MFSRDSRIEVNGNIINHPIEANIWQMSLTDQVDYLKSIATAGCNLGYEKPEDFVGWITWKLGDKIAGDYMIPYNQKMFSRELNQLGTYWLEKLPNVSIDETLLSCLTHKPYGEEPGHAQFYYPKKYGYGELWLRMANAVKKQIMYDQTVKQIDFNTKTVRTESGEEYAANKIITSIPWIEFESLLGMPESIHDSIRELKYTSIQTEYFPDHLDTEAHWIYYPDPALPYHRILVRHNFCPESRGYWTETNSERIGMEEPNDNFKYLNQYAYPLNTIAKPAAVQKLLFWCQGQGVYGLGRWGEHEHYNSDVTVERAMKLAEELTK